MKYMDLLQLYFDRSNALQWYWTIYVVVIGGLLAFSSLRQRPDFRTGILVTILYVCFAYKNLGAIRDVTYQRLAILDAIKSSPASVVDERYNQMAQSINGTLVAPAYGSIRTFHVATDVLTVAALWTMERRRRRSSSPVASAA